MVLWETEDEYSGPVVAALPTPNDTPYRTPSRNSRMSRRSATPPGKSSSPAAEKGDRGSKRSSRDVSTDEGISILDPRRFTPTLHANLVSEILSLRRDQEENLKVIDSLESSLHATREEQDAQRATHSATAKENRSLKRQLALLEGGTSSALGELARERDEAAESAAESKKRLDALQKKLRNEEEDAKRAHDLWTRDKEAWEQDKRKYERRIHVAETRLKAVLDEVAAFQAAHANGSSHGGLAGVDAEAEEGGKDNDAASTRTMSMTNSIRFSLLNGPGLAKPNGHSLADELNFEGDEEYDTDHGGRDSVLSHAVHARTALHESPVAKIHRRNQSNESLTRPGSVARGRLLFNQSVLERLEGGIIKEDDESPVPARKVVYKDTGIQFSPPPSPKPAPATVSMPGPEPPFQLVRPEKSHYELESLPRGDWEVEANQRRKRIQLSRPMSIPAAAGKMINGSSQTAEEPPSPPKTPKSPYQESISVLEGRAPLASLVRMVSSSTQTDFQRPPQFMPPPPPMLIPSISIHPPTSRPTTPREPRLPQLTKDFGCQVALATAPASRSTAVQTEEIRVDRRLDKLPAYLHPSAITSRPASPAAPDGQSDDGRNFTPVPGVLPPRNPRRLTSKRSVTEPSSSPPRVSAALLDEARDAYPGNNDDGPLSGQKAPMRRPHRISSLFAGFDGGSSDEADDFGEADLSDSEFRTALSAPKPRVNGIRPVKRSSSGTSAMAEVGAKAGGARSSVRIMSEPELPSTTAPTLSEEREGPEFSTTRSRLNRLSRAFEKSGLVSSNRSSVMRKAAMIQSGIATHQTQTRSRSPSWPEPQEPPFPIPTRASSRKPPISASAPSDGQRSPTRPGDSWHRRGVGRSHYRANSIRKVRSAAAIPGKQKYQRRNSRSPPPPLSPVEIPDTPSLPPLPRHETPTLPRHQQEASTAAGQRSHQPRLSTTTANTQDTGFASTGSASQATGVVDAIAQTMVGEWMFKYVRRRKSFSVGEASGKEDNSNDRHKRWVWLAPYERAILWSSKQPVSGSALMGKSGRKLTIQSVLDVKDDNPAPKGSTTVFNRSILILTPQRALKFTALNAERHYVWLTALSFLAHSQQAVPDIVAVAPPKAAPDFELPRAKLRKPGIRDSIRLAKTKTSSTRPGAVSVASSHTGDLPPSLPSMPSIPPSLVHYKPSAAEHPASAQPVHHREPSREVAEGPYIPRFHERANQVVLHGRKRSNTGGHVPPPLSFRGFSGPAGGGSGGSGYHAATNSTAGASTGTAGSSDIYQLSQGGGSSNMTWAMGTSGAGSQRTSEASSRPAHVHGGGGGGGVMGANFFDAIGTVRMEAFISPLAFSSPDAGYPDDDTRGLARRRSKELRRRASRSRHDSRNRDSYHSRGTTATAGTPSVDDFYFREDPFRGF